MFHSLFFQYIVIPTRRSTASAFQILMSHAFGDAGSPYLIGVVSHCFWRQISKRTTNKRIVSKRKKNINQRWCLFQMSDAIKANHVPEHAGETAANFISLQYALYLNCFVCVLGGAFFLATALFVGEDKARADRLVKGLYWFILFPGNVCGNLHQLHSQLTHASKLNTYNFWSSCLVFFTALVFGLFYLLSLLWRCQAVCR